MKRSSRPTACLSSVVLACLLISQEGTHVDGAYFGELGYEFLLFLPMLNYYRNLGMLRNTAGVIGSEPFYRFSPNHTEVDLPRRYCRGPFSNPMPHMIRENWNFEHWHPPPLRDYHRNSLLGADPPVVIVHNKHNKEWEEAGPVNTLDIPTLKALFRMLKGHYKVVYIRPDPRQSLPGFSADMNAVVDFPDFEEIRSEHPEVIIFQDLLHHQRRTGGPGQTYNELQMLVHADCERLISVQGGSSILASYFAGTNIVYAVMGKEVRPDSVLGFVYPKLGLNGQGNIVHVKTYDQVLEAARTHFLGGVANY